MNWFKRSVIISVAALLLVLGVAVAELPGSQVKAGPAESVSASTQISAHNLNPGGYQCDPGVWYFVINGLGETSDAPASIYVTWANGNTETVPLLEINGKAAKYSTTSNLNSAVTSATAWIDTSYNNFNLSHGPCNPTQTPTAAPSSTPTQTPTAIPSSTPTQTPTIAPSATPTQTLTVTPSPTATVPADPSGTPTATATATMPADPSTTPTATATVPADPSGTPTATPTVTATPTSAPPSNDGGGDGDYKPWNTPTPVPTSAPAVAAIVPTAAPTLVVQVLQARSEPTVVPTPVPTVEPTVEPAVDPAEPQDQVDVLPARSESRPAALPNAGEATSADWMWLALVGGALLVTSFGFRKSSRGRV